MYFLKNKLSGSNFSLSTIILIIRNIAYDILTLSVASFFTDFEKLDFHFESRKQRQAEQRDPVLSQLQGLVQTLQDTADRITGSESNLEALIKKQLADTMARYLAKHCLCISQRVYVATWSLFSCLSIYSGNYQEILAPCSYRA